MYVNNNSFLYDSNLVSKMLQIVPRMSIPEEDGRKENRSDGIPTLDFIEV